MPRHIRAFVIMISALSVGQPIFAGMVLTATGQAQGFSLTTFATGFSSVGGVGPIGVAFTPSGGVLVTEYNGDLLLFSADVDGQSASGASKVQSFGYANATGMAQFGSSIYMNQAANSNVVQLNADGSIAQLVQHIANPVANNLTGIAIDPANGHLFVSVPTAPGSFNEIVDVDPVSKTSSIFVSGVFTDGLAFSSDGSVVYAATSSNSITGFDALTGAVTLGPVAVNGGPDGIAVGTGMLSGNLFINTNDGEIIDFNLGTLSQTVIATGGSRGDLLYVDPASSTLLVTQSDSILRIGAPSGGGFFSAVPEPASIALWSFALFGFGLRRIVRHGTSSDR